MLCVKLYTLACRGISKANILSENPMSVRRKSGVFFPGMVRYKISFLEISVSART